MVPLQALPFSRRKKNTMLPIIKHAQVMAEMEDGAFNSQALLFSRRERKKIIQHCRSSNMHKLPKTNFNKRSQAASTYRLRINKCMKLLTNQLRLQGEDFSPGNKDCLPVIYKRSLHSIHYPCFSTCLLLFLFQSLLNKKYVYSTKFGATWAREYLGASLGYKRHRIQM